MRQIKCDFFRIVTNRHSWFFYFLHPDFLNQNSYTKQFIGCTKWLVACFLTFIFHSVQQSWHVQFEWYDKDFLYGKPAFMSFTGKRPLRQSAYWNKHNSAIIKQTTKINSIVPLNLTQNTSNNVIQLSLLPKNDLGTTEVKAIVITFSLKLGDLRFIDIKFLKWLPLC